MTWVHQNILEDAVHYPTRVLHASIPVQSNTLSSHVTTAAQALSFLHHFPTKLLSPPWIGPVTHRFRLNPAPCRLLD